MGRAGVGELLAASQVQAAKVRKCGQMLDARVCDAFAPPQIEVTQVGQRSKLGQSGVGEGCVREVEAQKARKLAQMCQSRVCDGAVAKVEFLNWTESGKFLYQCFESRVVQGCCDAYFESAGTSTLPGVARAYAIPDPPCDWSARIL